MPTQKELAKLAGVSSGTVSNVISGSTRVSERSRQKVLKAIRDHNYHPNLIARSLKTNRTNTLGIVVPDITIPFFPKIVRGAESAARERDYFLVVLDSENSHARAENASLLSGCPVIYLDRLPDGIKVDSVSVNDRSAAEMGTSHLISMGHRDIAILTGPLKLKNEQERLRGYRQALQKAGLPIRDTLIWPGSFDKDEIARICQSGLLKPSRRPSALFTTNGVTGLGALRSMYAAGLTTPRNIAFVTFDELTADEFFRPAVTTILQPAFDIGYRAVEVLLDRIRIGQAAGPPQKVRLPATVVVRESSNTPYCDSSK